MEASVHLGVEEIKTQTTPFLVGGVATEGTGVNVQPIEADFDEADEDDEPYPFAPSATHWTTADDIKAKLRTGHTRQREYRYDDRGRIVGVIQ